MVVRAPILAYMIWFGIMFSPFGLIAIPLTLGLNAFFVITTIVIASWFSRYIYLALIRHTRRRVLQTLFRERALKQKQPFILISRSYDQSKTLVTSADVPGMNVPGQIALFEAMVYDLSHTHAIVVLGDKDLQPDDPAGRALFVAPWPEKPPATRALVWNEETRRLTHTLGKSWEDAFVLLASSAQFVLIIPAGSEGVRREVELLREHDLGSKTVVYMWPTRGSHPYTAICATPNAWEEIRQPLAAGGLALPPHSEGGGLLRLDSSLAVRKTYAPIPIRNILSAVVADDQLDELISGWMDEYGSRIFPEEWLPLQQGTPVSPANSSQAHLDPRDELDELYDRMLVDQEIEDLYLDSMREGVYQ